ncbi:MAG: Txe/YoeB family addiction module toxin [Opitutales bacterium]
MSYRVVFTKQAQKDAKKIARTDLKAKAAELIELLKNDPFQSPPPFEALVGALKGAYSRRINIQHRLVYQVMVEQQVVKVIRMWTHYGD